MDFTLPQNRVMLGTTRPGTGRICVEGTMLNLLHVLRDVAIGAFAILSLGVVIAIATRVLELFAP